MPSVPVHHTPTSSSGWQASKQVANIYEPDLTKSEAFDVWAWFDPDGSPTKESTYRVPHHFVTNHKPGAASTEACSAGIAALNSGSTIPKADKKGVYAHLKAHLVDHGVKEADVPELKELAPDVETRAAKYNQADRDKMAGKEAMSDGSYPIKDADDLQKAIHAVGRGGADHDSIRKHIIARAKALGLSKDIPDNWNADGSLAETNAAKKDCPTCEGTGSIRPAGSGNVTCPDCDGSGTADGASENKGHESDVERRKTRAEQLRGRERRTIASGPVEVRSQDDGQLHLTGYASVFDRPYDVGWYQETIKRGAFSKTLNEGAQVQLLLNHEGLPLASTRNGTLQLSEDGVGLKVDATLDPEDPDSQTVIRKVRSGLMDEMSFAFQAIKQDWDEDYTNRALTEVSIDKGDVSVVNWGANPATSVEARSAEIEQASLLVGLKASILNRCLEIQGWEMRAGAAISTANMALVKEALALVADADTGVDKAQVVLSKLAGVTNPDIAQDKKLNYSDPSANSSNSNGESDGPSMSTNSIPDHTLEARQRLAAVRNRGAA